MKNPLHDELLRLKPEGEAPLRCDKTACWSFEDKVYIFGGFGPPPTTQLGMQGNLSQPLIDLYLYFELSVFVFCILPGNLYHFVEDPSTVAPYGGYIRGWSNQLVVYNKNTNRSDERFVNTYLIYTPNHKQEYQVIYDALNDMARLKLTLINYFPFKLILNGSQESCF